VPVYAKHVQIMLEQWHRLGEQEIDLQPLIHNLTLVWRTIITTTTSRVAVVPSFEISKWPVCISR